MKFEFIQAHQDEYRVVKMCEVLNVSKSGYYKWLHLKDEVSERKERQDELRRKISKSYHESGGTYGSPRIHQDLLEWGYIVSQKTVARLMREMELTAIPESKYITTTDSNHEEFVYPNLLERQFMVEAPNTAWVADITYIWTLEGWLYLASIMDLFSRKIVGWSLDVTMKKELPLEALEVALTLRQPQGELIHHSDRGSQYCSTEYIQTLNNYEESQVGISMSRKGDPYDNACIESFHATIKKELIYRRRFRTRKEAIDSITHYINHFYNGKRRHSTLGYLSPNDFEKKYHQNGKVKIA